MRVYRELSGTSINGMTFKGRAERLGWYRGSVCDGGAITSYYKSFPASGTDVFLSLDGFYIGIDMYATINLGKVSFVKHGVVKVGSYTYDEPHGDDDPRIIPLGIIPPIVFSEVMGDLQEDLRQDGRRWRRGAAGGVNRDLQSRFGALGRRWNDSKKL